MENFKEKRFLSILYYMLLGVETDIFGNKVLQISECSTNYQKIDDIMHNSFKPFEFLLQKVKEFSIIPIFLPFIDRYFRRVLVLREKVTTVEELFVYLQEDIEIFRELDILHNEIKLCNLGIFSDFFIENRLFDTDDVCIRDENKDERTSVSKFNHNFQSRFLKSLSRNGIVYKHFHVTCRDILQKNIDLWINYSIATEIILQNNCSEFSRCFWEDMFVFNCSYVDAPLSSEILTCGKIVYLIRTIFSIEIVTIEKPSKERMLEMFTDDVINRISRRIDIETFFLEPVNFEICNIRARRIELEKRLNILIDSQISNEIDFIYDVLLFRNFSAYEEIFSKIESEKVAINRIKDFIQSHEFMFKSNAQLSISCTGTPLSKYLLSLLDGESHSNIAVQTFSEILQIDFLPQYLKYFVSSSFFTELKIINRFLIVLSHLIYRLQSRFGEAINRDSKVSFLHLSFLVLNQLYNSEIPRLDNNSILEFQYDLKSQIKLFLQNFYLTNKCIFQKITALFDLCYEFLDQPIITVEIDKQYTNQLINIIQQIYYLTSKRENDDFADYLSYFIKLNKIIHYFYVLSVPTSNVRLFYPCPV